MKVKGKSNNLELKTFLLSGDFSALDKEFHIYNAKKYQFTKILS